MKEIWKEYPQDNRYKASSFGRFKGKMYYLGSYKTQEEAYISYIDALYEYELTK